MDLAKLLIDIRSVLDIRLFSLAGTDVTAMTLGSMALVMLLAYGVSRGTRASIDRLARARGLAMGSGLLLTARFIHYAVMLVGSAIALQSTGIDLGALFAAGAIFAAALGFALQQIAQDFISGIILLVEQQIKQGDILEVDGRIVKVLEVGTRTTLVRTREDEDMIVPNSHLTQETIKNFTLKDRLYRLRVPVGVSYGSDLALVRGVLEQVSADATFRNQHRDPMVLLIEFGTSSVDYEVSVWIDDPWNARPAMSRLREAIWLAFKEHSVTIAFPQVDVHLDRDVTESIRSWRGAA